MALTKRVEVLFDPEDYRAIEALARARGQTVGSLIREALKRQYLRPVWEQRQAAIRDLLREAIDLGSWEEAKAAIEREVTKNLETP